MAPSANATAAQALDALDRLGTSPLAAKDTTEVIVLEDKPPTPTKDVVAPSTGDVTLTTKDGAAATTTKDDDTKSSAPNVTPTATSGGVSPALAVAIVGGIIGVGCGTGAIVTSVDLANKLTAAKNGQRPLDQKAYDNGSTVFWLLTACTGVGIAGAGVGGAFVALE